MLSGCAVPAYQARNDGPVCEPRLVPAAGRGEVEALTRRLEERDAELARLRAALDERDERASYEKAQALGIVEAVKASRLPERQQRRIAVAIVQEAELQRY